MVIEADTPTVETPDAVALSVKAAILAEQARLNLSERQLALHYGVGRMTIWRWKSGQFSRSDYALAGILLNSPTDRSVT